MARLNFKVEDDSDEELPDLDTVIRQFSGTSLTPPKKTSIKNPKSSNLAIMVAETSSRRTLNASSNEEQSQRHRSLEPIKLTQVNSLLPAPSATSLICAKKPLSGEKVLREAERIRSTPKRSTKAHLDYSRFLSRHRGGSPSISEDDDSFTDLSGFIVPDSASEGDESPVHSPRKQSCVSSKQRSLKGPRKGSQQIQASRKALDTVDLISPAEQPSPLSDPTGTENHVQHTESSDLDEPFSLLKFSPPRSKTPHRLKKGERPVTPPTSPSKVRLDSPSKKHRIPPSPHRPSIDAFWSQEVVNDWNDEYSPKKPSRTLGRDRLLTVNEDDNPSSPPASPSKSPSKSPTKQARQVAKAFNTTKTNLASTFLADLDRTITRFQISHLTVSTGGVQILWSKKLSSTAGRANWRREAIRTRLPSGITSEATTYRHYASIELAEKVIDSEDRLLNVLAHEFCHLANFMISGVKDQPHGKSFKAWARKATDAFAGRGVEVTTKHGYEISYKYVWACQGGDDGSGCGTEYKRHSKSIDPSKHGCGACKGRLVQILPAPRKESEYQRFVKENWERVKAGAPGDAGMGEVMGLVAREFRGLQGGKGKEGGQGGEEEEGVGGEGRREESLELDGVARKLDFLKLVE